MTVHAPHPPSPHPSFVPVSPIPVCCCCCGTQTQKHTKKKKKKKKIATTFSELLIPSIPKLRDHDSKLLQGDSKVFDRNPLQQNKWKPLGIEEEEDKKKERRAAAAAWERTKHKPLRYSRRVR
jgi:hypothetical protein